jgi:hypothetical protein
VTPAEAAGYCLGALADAGDDLDLQARLHATLALVSWHDYNIGHHHAQLALPWSTKATSGPPRYTCEP